MLDVDMLQYAIQKDEGIKYKLKYGPGNVNLVITCMDLMVDFSYTYIGKIYHCKDGNDEESIRS